MTDKPNNPLAFPIIGPDGMILSAGMTLRDWFAGQALIGLIARSGVTGATDNAYKYADAMLARRRD